MAKNERTSFFNGIIIGLLVVYGSYAHLKVEGALVDQYLGCFHSTQIQTSGRGSFSIDECIKHCRDFNKSKTYARLTKGGSCDCDNEYGLQLNDALCNITCSGNSSQYCGGSQFAVSVYILYAVCPRGSYGDQCEKTCHCKDQVPCSRNSGMCPNGCHGNYSDTACDKLESFTEQYIGCFQDDGTARAMNHTAYFTENTYNSLQTCTDRCSLDYSYAGPQYQYQCFCGESYTRYGRKNDTGCKEPCSGKKSEYCGGGNALGVHHSCPSGNFGRRCREVCNCKIGRCFYHNGTCQNVSENACKSGWQGDTCGLRDCSDNNGNCRVDELCVSVEPVPSQSVSVCRCRQGFSRRQIWNNCTDINECTEIPDICGPNATHCSNTEGSYMCHCRNGVTVAGSNCETAILLDHYIGCFYNEDTQWSNETDSTSTISRIQTYIGCIEHCKRTSASESYARFQNGADCRCANDHGIQLHHSFCKISCGKNSSQFCGGERHDKLPTYSLYSVCPRGTYGPECNKSCHCYHHIPCDRKTGKCPSGCHGRYTGDTCATIKSFPDQYIGCYKDKSQPSSSRVMSGGAVNNNSLQFCTDLCSSRNNSYSGPQYASQCYCGESYNKYGNISEATCTMKCPGNKDENCGGGDALSVYHSCPLGYYGRSCAKLCKCRNSRCFFHNGTCQVGGCEPGWTGHTCSIRNCSDDNGSCKSTETCVTIELMMSMKISVCQCPKGTGKKQIWENCTANDDEWRVICGPYARNFNIDNGNYICHCQNGNKATTSACTSDINECVDFPGICGPYATSCNNTEGSYICHCQNGNNVTNSSCDEDALLDHYLGCFFDNKTDKIKETQRQTISANISSETVENCIKKCRTSENASYVRLRNSLECRCCDEPGLQLQESYCNITCGGNFSHNCSMALYSLLPSYILYSVCPLGTYGIQCEKACHCRLQRPCNRLTGKCPNGCHTNYFGAECDRLRNFSGQYIGCYEDKSNQDPAMDIKQTGVLNNSLQYCTDRCSVFRYSYSGAQYSTESFCGESYNRHGLHYSDDRCNMTCSGNKSEICGSSGSLSVYHTCPVGFYGYKCAKICHCNGSRCLFHNGTCLATGCKPGWTDHMCGKRDCSVNNGGCDSKESCVTVQPIEDKTITVCQCPTGFRKNWVSGSCEEIDECFEMPGICGPYSRSCSNIEGSYICHCQNGSNVTTSICTSDINECTDSPGICGPYASSCRNIEGSYICHCLNGSEVVNSSCSSDMALEHYVGCFYNTKDQLNNTIYPVLINDSDKVIERCIEYCRNSSKSYARLQNGTQCQCIDKSGLQVHSSLCNRTCGENATVMDGGLVCRDIQTYSLFTVCPIGTFGTHCRRACHCDRQTPCLRKSGKCPNGCYGNYIGDSCNIAKIFSEQYIGCYRDKGGNRAMTGETVFKNFVSNSLQICTEYCSDKLFSFSGPQYGVQCFCGESYNKHGIRNETDCSMNCPGNKSETCGGSSALSVYHSCPSGNYGRYCSKTCNCENSRCFFQNGTCKVPGCRPGWTGSTCILRDCSANKGDCSINESCEAIEPVSVRTRPISVCQCLAGYGRSTVGAKCTDIDECKTFPNSCGPYSISCYNTEGSYICHCRNGYNITNSVCTSDLNECTDQPGICGQFSTACFNIEGSYICRCHDGNNVTNSSCATYGKFGSDGNSSVVAAVIIPLLLLVIALVAFGILYFRRVQLPPRKADETKTSVGMKEKFPIEEDSHPKHEVVLISTPISTQALPDFVKSKLSAPDLVEEEFKSVPQETKNPCSAGRNLNLKVKNRFKNIVPYDYNRVVLKKIGNNVLSDYINASFINTYHPTDKFIATQGPKPETVDDFWRMICEQDVGVIVMITNLVENGKTKCEKYWPDAGSSALFGEISVETQSEERWNDYTARKLSVQSDTKSLNIIQWHFLPWPDHGVPSDANSFLNFRRGVRKCITRGKSVVVHCSAGAGRTGCFISVDYLLEQEKVQGSVDIYGCLKQMRQLRCQMVQTLDQYQFIHRVLLLSVTIGETAIPTAKFSAKLKQLNALIPGKKVSLLDTQYEVLKESENNLAGINRAQVFLKDSDDSKISELEPHFSWGWKTKDAFITLNHPTANTVLDFYELCKEYNCHSIIIIDTEKILDRTVFPSTKDINLRQQIISCEGSAKEEFGTSYKISARKPADDTYANFGQFDIYANTGSLSSEDKSDVANMTVLHLTESVGKDTLGCLSLISLYRKLKPLKEDTQRSSTIVISRSDLKLSGYCLAALNAFDMCADEAEVDVFQIVQEIRKSRQQFEFSATAFKELYSTIGQFIQTSV